jgi:hypothetical protein
MLDFFKIISKNSEGQGGGKGNGGRGSDLWGNNTGIWAAKRKHFTLTFISQIIAGTSNIPPKESGDPQVLLGTW